jgi:hypothetical protein
MYQACGAAIYNGQPVLTAFSGGAEFCTKGLAEASNIPVEVSATNCFNSATNVKVSWFIVAAAVALALW